MAVSTIKSKVYSVTTPTITVSANTNISDYVPINATLIEVAPTNKTAFATFAKNNVAGQWWVRMTDWENVAITGSYQLVIKYIM